MKEKTSAPPPLIGVTGESHLHEGKASCRVDRKYIRVVEEDVGAAAVVIPPSEAGVKCEALLSHLDGVLFTGSISNIEPHHYGAEKMADGGPYDPARDVVTLPLLRRAVAQGVPVLCICRGHQELNVALGGTLCQRLESLPGLQSHFCARRPS